MRLNPVRWAYLAIGWSLVGLAGLGVILPVLPTTPFLILALWAFSKSSPRFERWLLESRWFGPYLQQWQSHRVIPLRAKILSSSMMALTLVYSLATRRAPWWGLLGMALVMGWGTWYVWTKPSQAPEPSGES